MSDKPEDKKQGSQKHSTQKQSSQQQSSAVQRYAAGNQSAVDQLLDNPEVHSGPFYARERESHGPALSLTLRLKNGNSRTIEYAHRVEMAYDAELGIEMIYSTGLKITIKGQHLDKLYEDLALHKVLWIQSRDTLHTYKQISDVTGKPLPIVLDVIIERGSIDFETGLFKPAPGTWSSDRQSWIPSGSQYMN